MNEVKAYLDNAATTKPDPAVLEAMLEAPHGNPESRHLAGELARQALEEARRVIAERVGASPEEIIFTSGGTESNNLAVKGIAKALKGKGVIVTSKAEHKSVLEACKDLEREGFEVVYLNVDRSGKVDLEELRQALSRGAALVTLAHANNETGALQQIPKISELCREAGALLHLDCVQSLCKEQLDLSLVDAASYSSHKVHGPKGVGALYLKKGTPVKPLLSGGPQERGLRPGTQNVPGIKGFAKAVQLYTEEELRKVKELHNYLESRLKLVEGVKINGEERVPTITSVTVQGVEADALVKHLNSKGVCVSTSSACTASEMKPSHVLTAMGFGEDALSTLRVSIGRLTTKEEINFFLKSFEETVNALRKLG